MQRIWTREELSCYRVSDQCVASRVTSALRLEVLGYVLVLHPRGEELSL